MLLGNLAFTIPLVVCYKNLKTPSKKQMANFLLLHLHEQHKPVDKTQYSLLHLLLWICKEYRKPVRGGIHVLPPLIIGMSLFSI